MKNGKFLYVMIYNTLKQEIMDGKYQFGSFLPSEREICQRFNVERTTARKAMELLVNEDLVEKKAGIGTRVIFHNNVTAKPIPQQSNARVIGVFMADDVNSNKKIMQPYYAELFYHLEIEGKARDCQVMYATINPSTNISEILQSQNFLAVIFISNVEIQYIQLVQKMNIPTIVINDYKEGIPCITYDNVGGSSKVIEYLYSLGHKNIALITGPTSYFTSSEKLAGCLEALFKYDLTFTKENVVQGNWEFQGGYDCAMKIFEGRNNSNRPTALFVFNDMMAIGAMRALKDLSLRVPEDVSIVGFDNMEQLKYTEPFLTTVDTHIATVAKIAIESIVIEPFQIFQSALKILVPTKIVTGGTVKDLSQSTK